MTISERIFELLDKQGKRQADLVRVCNVRPNTVSDWKAKRRNPDVSLLGNIADFFGVSVDYLVTGKEPPAPAFNQSIVGSQNSHNTITINGNAPRELSEIEAEVLRICSGLDTIKKAELLVAARDISKKE